MPAKEFAKNTMFPTDCLYFDASAQCCAALGFEPGFGRSSGQFNPAASSSLSLVVYGAVNDSTDVAYRAVNNSTDVAYGRAWRSQRQS
eukprot:3241413-Rhodomonas_salina.3